MSDTTADVPASYRIRRTVPPYNPAKTPYVGKQVPLFTGAPWQRDKKPVAYVVIRETDVPTSYWVAPILPDGTLGKMTTAPLTKAELQS
jgi:hypothetical protein